MNRASQPVVVDSPQLCEAAGRVLVVRLGGEHDLLSWAVINGGLRRACAVVWRQVDDGELTVDADPVALARQSLEVLGLPDAPALLTSRDVGRFVDVRCRDGAWSARCIATVGLGNALAAGDPPGLPRPVGTINVLCQVSAPLTEEALIEASALAAEARTAALLEAQVPSRVSGRPATGTGTDCIVIAAPAEEPRQKYAGKHTALGALIGRSVREATGRGAAEWLGELRRPGSR